MKIQIQVLDCDYKMLRGKPLIRIYGKTEKGEPIAVFYDRFLPYFYAQVADEKKDDFVREIKERFNANTEEVERYLPIGYGPKVKVLKITGKDPGSVPEMKEMAYRYGTPYEADILFRYRFMADFGIKGMCWIEAEGDLERTDTVSCKALMADSIKPVENPKNIPLKYMALDIETIPEGDRVPEAGKDEIIMISMAFKPAWNGHDKTVILAKPHKSADKDVMGVPSEMEMLKKFADIVADYDPDIITGYNINAFDMPFITERMKTYGLLPQLGRCEKPVLIKKMQNSMLVNITGRIVADTYDVIKRDPWMKFKRYDLRTVAKELLKSEKLDMGGVAEIKAHWAAGAEKLDRLIEYCVRDSELAMKLVKEKNLLDKFYELAKVSGLLLQDAFGGQAQRHENKLLCAFKQRDIVMPCKPEGDEMKRRDIERKKVGLKGAVVLEPAVGLHTGGSVLVLDFASLYPSIIRSFNICPTTYVRGETSAKFHTAPNNARFVDTSVREGVLPAVVKELVETRAAVKRQMKTTTEPELIRQLNAKQLALKDMANSLYGYTGYIRSRLYVMDVAGAITSYGRENIVKTKELVENNFNVKVLYGDTDSIFMKTDIADLDRAQQKGEEISAYVTERLPGLKFAFEKIFKTFLILSKKRYAGWKFEKAGDVWKDKLEMKGIETVRRDWCELTTESMSEVLRIILKEQDSKKAIAYTRDVVKGLSEGKVPLEKLTVVKGITRGLGAYKGMQPHIELAKKIMARDPTKSSMVGERLGYVIVKGNALLSMRAEDPTYAKEKGLEIDSQYYVENQLLPPLERIFDALGVSRIEVLEGVRQKNLAEMFGGKRPNSPEQTVLNGWDSITCRKCGWNATVPPLAGVCPKCGDQIFFSKGGELGKFVKG
jgi:DNA polymerase I